MFIWALKQDLIVGTCLGALPPISDTRPVWPSGNGCLCKVTGPKNRWFVVEERGKNGNFKSKDVKKARRRCSDRLRHLAFFLMDQVHNRRLPVPVLLE